VRSKASVTRALVAASALAAGLLWPSSASAARGHELTSTIGEACLSVPCGPGKLKAPSALAVNEASGDIYVLDEGDARVERFSQAGQYEGQFDGSGKFEVTSDPEPSKEGTAAGFGGKVGEKETGKLSFTGEPQISGIAVDNACALQHLSGSTCETADPSNGDVYVIDAGHEVIDKFNARGEYLGQISEASGEALLEADGVAVDEEGGVWLIQLGRSSNGVLDSFDNTLANSFHEALAFEEPGSRGFLTPGLALDGESAFYLLSRENGEHRAEKFNPQGHRTIERLDNEEASGIAADQESNQSFLDNVNTLAAFSENGSKLERLPVPGEHGAGLAVDAASETLYAADTQANLIYTYGPQQPGPPSIEAASAFDVSADSASLEGEVNPRGATTSYRFEYGPCDTPASCASSPYPETAPVPDGQLGADFEIHQVGAHVQGLSAQTLYHFRLSARNEAGGEVNEVKGEERLFSTQPGGGTLTLPDGRGWELVSPVDKLGSLILPIGIGVVQASVSGNAISYLANAPIEANPQGAEPQDAQILSQHTTAGWGSQNLTVPHVGTTGAPNGTGREFRFFSDDLAFGFAQPFGAFDPAISPEASEQSAFERTNFLGGDPSKPCEPAMGCYRPLVSGAAGVANVPSGTVFGQTSVEEEGAHCPPAGVCGPEFEDATPEGAHAIVRSLVALTGTPITGESLYEWSAQAPPATQLQLVSLLPGAGGPASEPQLGFKNHNTRGALSGDGARVVFEAQSPSALYLRDVAKAQTIELDSAEVGCGECESGGGRFQLASSDGSRVLFTDAKRLTSDAGTAGKADLYQCLIVEGSGGKEECRLSDLTPKAGGESADVLGALPGASEDAQWIYFAANGALTSSADSQGEHALRGNCESGTPGASCNMYLLHDGQLRLVSVLGGEDFHDWFALPSARPTRVSPNGQWLALMSQRSLTSGYDNRDAVTGRPDAEVYLYSAASDRLVCASCEPSGARPSGIEYKKLEPGSGGIAGGPARVWEEKAPVAANLPGWTANAELGAVSRHQPRYLTDEGRLFFNSLDGLVPEDENGTEDVYQYEPSGIAEPAGIAGCGPGSPGYSEAASGCVQAISSGSSTQESAFLDASESGADVFFLTSAKLVGKDKDASYDVYDAHQCTPSAPCPPAEATEPPPCETADSCKAAPSPQPEIFGAPPSALFSGQGNLPPPPQGKGPSKAEQLAKALKSCRKRFAHAKKRRQSCESKARRQFGAKKASSKRHRAKKSAKSDQRGSGR
jgi:DNA-binding beta-propeller fold protein YncE